MQSTQKRTRPYSLLTPTDREEIMIGRRNGRSIRWIARKLGRHPSVISREIRSNQTEDGRYQSTWAQNRSTQRRKKSRQREWMANRELRAYVRENLAIGWSPEQIAGRISIDKPWLTVSHETIYRYVFKKDRSLVKYLQCGRKHRRKRVNTRAKRVMIPDRTSIEVRPEDINNRESIGHWEGDTAVSRESPAALLVLQERVLGLTLLSKLPRCAPKELQQETVRRLQELPEQFRRSVTFDNGQENRHHKKIRDALGVDTYFCNPYSSWEKGSVENAVGLTRRVWPKKTDYALIPDEEIAMLEYRLNTRPRKRLGFLTPLECALGVALTF